MSNRTLILGLGNDLLRDDAIGLRIAGELGKAPDLPPNTVVSSTTEMGISLLEHMSGFDRVVLVDSIQTRRVPPGHVHSVDESKLKTLPFPSPHFLGIGEVLALGRALGMNVANNVRVIAIEVEDPYTVSSDLSPTLEALLPALVSRVKELAFTGSGSRAG